MNSYKRHNNDGPPLWVIILFFLAFIVLMGVVGYLDHPTPIELNEPYKVRN